MSAAHQVPALTILGAVLALVVHLFVGYLRDTTSLIAAGATQVAVSVNATAEATASLERRIQELTRAVESMRRPAPRADAE